MNYNLKIGEEIKEVGSRLTDGVGEFSIDDQILKATYQRISENEISLAVDGKRIRAYVADDRDGKHVFIDGRAFYLKDADREPKKRGAAANDQPGAVTPPMPSVVLKVAVQEGDQITKGQALVIVSAMKMETTLSAPCAGVVKKVNTREDANVNPGDILVEIEEADE